MTDERVQITSAQREATLPKGSSELKSDHELQQQTFSRKYKFSSCFHWIPRFHPSCKSYWPIPFYSWFQATKEVLAYPLRIIMGLHRLAELLLFSYTEQQLDPASDLDFQIMFNYSVLTVSKGGMLPAEFCWKKAGSVFGIFPAFSSQGLFAEVVLDQEDQEAAWLVLRTLHISFRNKLLDFCSKILLDFA